MLDIRFIRENANLLQVVAQNKGIEISIAELLELDQKRRVVLQELEHERSKRNKLTQKIAQEAKQGHETEADKERVKELNGRIKDLDAKHKILHEKYTQLMELVPNIYSPDTPVGASDEENVEIKKVGKLPNFAFQPKDHLELGELHDLFDLKRGVKVGGSRQYFLKNAGLYLHRAVQQLAIDLLADRGFTLMDVPLMVTEESLYNTGFFPLGREQTYELPKDEKWLVGTAEVPLVAYYSQEIIDVDQPIRIAAVSNCFRREAGSAGRDVRGLYRVHQFAKVEQVILCQADLAVAETMLQEITKNAEDLLDLLELPYRVVQVCTGDMGQKNYKQYDIETWMPSRESYGETHSSSSLLDFQAHRAQIKYRDQHGELRYCYTLNNTAVATPRILIPLLENHQQDDGSIYIPKALRSYLQNKVVLKP